LEGRNLPANFEDPSPTGLIQNQRKNQPDFNPFLILQAIAQSMYTSIKLEQMFHLRNSELGKVLKN